MPAPSLVDYSKSLRPSVPKDDQRDAVEVFDKASGTTRWVPPQVAEESFIGGAVNLPSAREIPVAMPDGQTGKVDAERVSQALADGAHLITDRQERAVALEKEYGGAKGMAISGLAGVARGATFGASDEAAQLLAGPAGEERVREALEASKEFHPIASTAGEVGGMALGSALTPGAGLGAMAEHGAEGLLARASTGALTRGAEGLGARALTRGAGLAARGALEGSEIGLQQTLSEAALHEDGNAALTGEKIVAAMGHGAFVGAVAGGLTGAGVEGIATAGRSLARNAKPWLEQAANREMWRDLNSSKAITKQVTSRVKGGIEAIGATARAEGLDSPSLSVEEQWNRAGEAKERVGGQIGDIFRQSGASAKPRALLEKLDGVIQEVSGKAGFENVANQLQGYKESLAERLFQGLQTGETFMTPAEQQMSALERKMLSEGAADEAVGEVRKIRDAMMGERSAKARELAERTIEDHEVPLVELWKQRRNLDQLLRWDGRDPAMGSKVDELRKFRGMFEDFLSTEGERANPGFAGELKSLKTQYQHLAIINDTLEEKVARELTNRRFSLTDSIAQGGGHAGGMALLSAGHPMGAAMSLGAGVANKFLREQGPRLGAYVLGRIGGLEQVAAHIGSVDSTIERAVTNFVERPAERVSGVYPTFGTGSRVAEADDGVEDRFLLKAESLKLAAAHPELGARVDERLSSIAPHAPDAARAAADTAKRGISFLAKELPAQMSVDPLRPRDMAPPPLAKMDEWLRKERAVSDPASVFYDLAHGRIDPVAVTALKSVYPTLYTKFQTSVRNAVVEKNRDLSHQERLQLAVALDTPTTPSLTPNGVAARQATFTAPPPTKGASAPRRSGGKLVEGTALATAGQQLERGD